MNNFYILEINVNNQLRHAYSAETKKNLLRQIKIDNEYDDEYYLIYQYDLDNSIKILFENKSIQKIEDFLVN